MAGEQKIIIIVFLNNACQGQDAFAANIGPKVTYSGPKVVNSDPV